jgi:hypothetical protein
MMVSLQQNLGEARQRIVSIKFKMERRGIKSGLKEERKRSIFKLEQEKNLVFNPRKGRSQSLPNIHAQFRVKAIKEMREDILLAKYTAPNEFKQNETLSKVRVSQFNFNDIGREILEQPVEIEEVLRPASSHGNPSSSNSQFNRQGSAFGNYKFARNTDSNKEEAKEEEPRVIRRLLFTRKYETSRQIEHIMIEN